LVGFHGERSGDGEEEREEDSHRGVVSWQSSVFSKKKN
jgi:hypothetical protein